MSEADPPADDREPGPAGTARRDAWSAALGAGVPGGAAGDPLAPLNAAFAEFTRAWLGDVPAAPAAGPRAAPGGATHPGPEVGAGLAHYQSCLAAFQVAAGAYATAMGGIAEETAARLREHLGDGATSTAEGLHTIHRQWVETGEAVHAAHAFTDAYAGLLRDFVEAGARLEAARRQLAEGLIAGLELARRAELEALERRVETLEARIAAASASTRPGRED